MSQYGSFVSVSIDAGIATIRIDRPKVNALNAEIQDGLFAAASELAGDSSVRAAIITGGEKVFAAGVDIKEMEQMSYVDMVDRGTILQNGFASLAQLPFPTVAAIEGYALGGGFELAMTADFRIASTSATVGQPEVLLGLIPGAGGTQRLTRLVGQQKAKELIYTGRMVKADEALELGMVDKLVEPGTTHAAAVEMLTPMVAGPRVALRFAKEAINRGQDGDLSTGLAIETQLFTGLFATQDRAIGMTSFVENGPGKAAFQGR